MENLTFWVTAGCEAVFAVGFLSAAAVLLSKQKAKLSRCYRVEGEVVEVKVSNDEVKKPVIRFLSNQGQPVTFTSTFGNSNWKINVGDRIWVLADPEKPMEAIVDQFMPKWGLPFVFGVIGGGSLIGIPVIYFALYRH